MSDALRRILLLGSDGQVGFELRTALAPLGAVVALDRDQADFAQPESLREVVRAMKPEVVVNAAAYTAVDRAEQEPALAMRINGEAPGVLAQESARRGALLVHYSTDAVFDGTKGSPYVETDAPNPVNAYGRSKWEGERAVQAAAGPHLILRTSWVYAARGHNFVRTILRLAAERDELRVVNDQFGNPTSARVLAAATARLLRRALEAPAKAPLGVHHATGSGGTSWFEFARAIIDLSAARGGRRVPVAAIPTSEYPLPAARGRDSRLDGAKLAGVLGAAQPPWRESLAEVVDQLSP